MVYCVKQSPPVRTKLDKMLCALTSLDSEGMSQRFPEMQACWFGEPDRL